MKKIIISISAVIVVMSIAFAGCGMDKNADTTSTGTTTSTTVTSENTTEEENLEDRITSVLDDATTIFDRESSAATTR